MRGSDERSGELFSYVDLEKRVRADHPLRAIRVLTDSALEALSGDFAALYSGLGRPSIALEMLLRAMLLQAFYSVRSEPTRCRLDHSGSTSHGGRQHGGVQASTFGTPQQRCGCQTRNHNRFLRLNNFLDRL